MKTLILTEFEAKLVKGAIAHFVVCDYASNEWLEDKELPNCPCCALDRIVESLEEKDK